MNQLIYMAFLGIFFMVGCRDNSNSVNSENHCQSVDFYGYIYRTVEIGGECWFAENLRAEMYANGDPIPLAITDEAWANQEMGMRCAYEHNNAHLSKYGYLYNWYAVHDARNLCPDGWHVSTDKDWQLLEVALGLGQADAIFEGWRGTDLLNLALHLKSKTGWDSIGGTNSTNFSALPGGSRNNLGDYEHRGEYGTYWCSKSVVARWMNNSINNGISRFVISDDVFLEAGQRIGSSCRCVRNSNES